MSAAQVGRVLELDSPGSSEIFESVEVLPGRIRSQRKRPYR